MKIAQINVTCGAGSTGKICLSVAQILSEKEIDNIVFHSQGRCEDEKAIRYMSDLEIRIQALKSRIFGNYGFQSRSATKRLIGHLESIQPDIVHLHNLHGHNVNLSMLLTYLKEKKIRVFWTFHDCWAFTAYCPHYTMAGCDQWKTGCKKCPQIKCFSWFFDRSKKLFEEKKRLLLGLDLTVITPSQWLADQVKMSFLKDVEVKVINNGIDLSIFQPTPSDFKEKYGLEDKKIVLGVAFGWGKRKGLDVMIELSKRLPDDYRVVLVGTNDEVDKQLPSSILSIHRTSNQTDLAKIYTAADVFVNPTREENYPTTHMEAIACHTPVIAFDVGGCKEMLKDGVGCVVAKNDIDAMCSAIYQMTASKLDNDLFASNAKSFDNNDRWIDYVDLYGVEL